MENEGLIIDEIIIDQNEVEQFRSQFGKNASEQLMRDLVFDFQDDYRDEIAQDPNFMSPELMQSGQATFYDKLSPDYGRQILDDKGQLKFVPFRDMSLQQRRAIFSDPDEVTSLITGVERTSLPSAAISEFVKTVPSIVAGKEAAAATARLTLGRGISPNPYVAFAQLSAPVASFFAGSLLTYEGADLLEDELIGEAEVVLPGQRTAVEVARTAGGLTAGVSFPFLLRKQGLTSSRNALENIAEGSSPRVSQKIGAFIEEYLEKTARTAKGSKTGAALTVTGEAIAAPGTLAGAYAAEEFAPGSTSARLFGELAGGNIFASTFGRMLAPSYAKLQEAELDKAVSFEDLLQRSVKKDEEKLFKRINELYELNDGNYDAMMDNLNSPEIDSLLKEVFPNIDFTAAQRLQDDTGIIMMLEAKMAGESQELAAQRAKNGRNAFSFFSKYINGLQTEGSEASLKKAAQMRQAVIGNLLQNRLSGAIEKRIDAIKRVFADPNKPEQQVAATKKFATDLADTMETSLGFARKMSEDLWGKVDDTVVYTAEDIINGGVVPQYIQAYDDLIARMQPGFVDRWKAENAAIVGNVTALKRQLGFNILEKIKDAEAIMKQVDAVDMGPRSLINTQVETRFGNRSNNQKIDFFEDLLNTIDNEGKFVGIPIKTRPERTFEDTPLGMEASINRDVSVDQLNVDLNEQEQQNFSRFIKAKIALLQADQAKQELLNQNDPLRSKQLVAIRSALLKDASNIASNQLNTRGLSQSAFEIGELAEAVFDDLDTLEAGKNAAYDEARDFTKALHDVFTRSVIGRDRARTGQGGRRIPPEVAITKYIRGAPEATDLRIEELENISKFMYERGMGNEFEKGITEAVPGFTTIDNFITGFLRAARRENVYAEGTDRAGQIDFKALAEYRKKNQELLKRFPQLDQDLSNAVSAQRAFQFMEKNQEKINKAYDAQKFLQTLLHHSSPSQALADALNYTPKGSVQKDPVQGLTRLFKYVRGSERFYKNPDGSVMSGAERRAAMEQTKTGFKDAILNYVFMNSGGESVETFDPVNMYKRLFAPLKTAGGKTSLMDLATQNNIFTKQEVRNIKLVNEQMVRLAAADAAGQLMDKSLIEKSGPIFDFYVGLVGLAGGSAAFKAVSGGTSGVGSISAPQMGKRLVLDYLKELPAVAKMQTLQTIFTDPDLVATLIRKPKSKADAEKTNRVVKGMLERKLFNVSQQMIPFVIREAAEEIDVQPEQEEEVVIPNDQGASLNIPAQAPTLPVGPAPSPSFQLASASLPQTTPQSGPVNRARYAAMFPNDPASALIRQGIGSMMG